VAVPTVTALDLSSGPAGTLVTITGTNFDNRVTRVTFGSVSCGTNFAVLSTTVLSAWVPAGTGTVYVTVTNPDGTSANSVQWTYSTYYGGSGSAPTVGGLNPTQSAYTDGRGGDSVTITGTYLTTAQAVYFGGAMAEFTVVSATSITAIAPPGSGTVDVIVVTLYGTSTNTVNDNFLYPTVSVPTITSLVPASGLEGDAVTINGTGFDTAMSVEFGTVPAVFLILSSTQIRCFVPFGLTAGTTYDVAVTNSGGVNTNTSGDNFTYSSLGTLKTTATNLQTSPSEGWTTTTPVSVALTAVYPPWPTNTYVESTWYRLNDGAATKYTSAISFDRTTLGEGSHKLEFWSVGLDGTVEPTNVGWVNMVASTTATGLTATAAIGAIVYGWTPINIPGARYDVCIGTSNPPSTTPVAVVNTTTYTYKIAAGATAVSCRVRLLMTDGTYGAYSSVVGPTTSLTLVATDLADEAISTAKLAPSLRPPPLLATAPSLPSASYPTGSYYYNTTDNILYVTNNGTSWSVASPTTTVAAKILAGVIEAGAIGAEELAANSVYAKNLVVADYENLIPNSNSEFDPTGKDTAYNSADIDFRGVTSVDKYRGTYSRRRAGTGTGSLDDTYIELCRPIPCKVGDKFRFTAWSKCSATQTSYGCRLQIFGLNSAFAEVAADNTLSTYNSTTTWTEQVVSHTVADSTVQYVVARAVYNGSSTGPTYGYFDDFLMRKSLGGQLIVDGTLSANAIYGGTITGADINVERALTLGSGGVIQTASSNERIVLAESTRDYLALYTGQAIENEGGRLEVSGSASQLQTILKSPAISGSPGSSLYLMCSTGPLSSALLYGDIIGIGNGIYGDVDDGTIHLYGAVNMGPSRASNIWREWDFFGTAGEHSTGNSSDIWQWLQLDSYSVAAYDGGANHPGCMSFTTGTGADDGGRCYTNTTSFTLPSTDSEDYCEFTFRCPALVANARINFGFRDWWTADGSDTPPAGSYGAYINIRGTTLYGKVVSGGTQFTTGSSYTLSTGTWYTARVVCTKTAILNQTAFYLYSEAGATLWSATLAYRPSTVPLMHGLNFYNVGTSAQNMLIMDYMNFCLEARSR